MGALTDFFSCSSSSMLVRVFLISWTRSKVSLSMIGAWWLSDLWISSSLLPILFFHRILGTCRLSIDRVFRILFVGSKFLSLCKSSNRCSMHNVANFSRLLCMVHTLIPRLLLMLVSSHSALMGAVWSIHLTPIATGDSVGTNHGFYPKFPK